MTSRLPLLIPALATIPLFVYLGIALSDVSFSTVLNLLMAISIGVAALVGSVAIYKDLEGTHSGVALTFGTLSLIIAFSFFVLMVIVQQAVFLGLREASSLDPSAAASVPYKSLSLGLNYVQLGMDVTFDVFYSLGLGSRAACLTMVFKLMESASKNWRALNGSALVRDVIAGVQFADGVKKEAA